MKMKVNIDNPNLRCSDLLSYAHDFDAGADIITQEDIIIKYGKNIITLGFSIELPQGCAGYIFPRSSVMGNNVSFNLAPIDPGYTGSWHLIAFNSGEDIFVEKKTRICQIVIMPFIQAQFVDHYDNLRTDNGVGSTGT